ncbi:hypothetical protein IGI39_004818 [Enterococcus sp. AZ135]|uniref:hypothetical protein n=1 Tax=unclassified Enterococcus TaxID=2608891 RepID=UPI003F272510
MKFFEIGQPVVALVCAKDKYACWDAYMLEIAETDNKIIFLADCHEIKFGQMLREVSEVLNIETYQPFGLDEAATQIFASVFQQEPVVFLMSGHTYE